MVTGGKDYYPVSSALRFPTSSRNGSQVCVNVTVVDDPVLEGTESFNVYLTTSDSNAKLLSDLLEIIIQDNDGKFCSLSN